MKKTIKLIGAKRSIAIIVLVAVIGFSIVSCEGIDPSEKDYSYNGTYDKITIIRYKGAGGNVTIPSKIDGYPVTSIGGSAFSKCTSLTSVKIPNSVTSIDYQAFQDCTGLTSVTIGNSVTSIGNYAFRGCTGLTSVTIPDIKELTDFT